MTADESDSYYPVLEPLPRRPVSSPRQPRNAGNTCYLSAIIVALFADHDAADALLHHTRNTSLLSALVDVINPIRTGKTATASSFQHLRRQLVANKWHAGRLQQDAAELFAHLMDLLRAPFIPLLKTIHHPYDAHPHDMAPFTERLLWLYPSEGTSIDGLLADFFDHGTIHGLRRGGVTTTAMVRQTLIPFYTSQRETGESTPITRDSFPVVLIPLAIARFSGSTRTARNRVNIHVPTAIRVSDYITPPHNLPYTLILRSIVCHLGHSISHGHYIAYTYAPESGWRRWDDMDYGHVQTCRSDTTTGLPENEAWKAEIERNCYLCFYELVPGECELEAIEWGKSHRDDDSVYSGSLQSIDTDTLFARFLQYEEDARAAKALENRTSSTVSERATPRTRSKSDCCKSNCSRHR